MRAKELDTLLGHVRANKTVRLVAGREFGRTTLLNELEVALIALGFSVVRVIGDPSLTNVKYAVLRETLVPADRLHQQATPSEVRDIIAIELSHSPNTVILVDDAEWLDLPSAQALAPLFDRGTIAGVFVSAPFQHLSPEQRVVSHILRADTRVELKALSFEQVGVLSETLLGGAVSPEVTSEIFSMSSGITGIAADIIRAAQSQRQIRKRSHRWVTAEHSLWNPHLEETIERLISPLQDGPFRLLHALALAGNLTAEQFHDFDAESAEALTRAGLITTFKDPHGQSRISPRPALVTDYFRQRPIDLLHLSAVRLLEQLSESSTGGGRRAERPRLRIDTRAQHSDTEETHNAGLARYLREESEERLAVTSREWRRRPDVVRAVAYLDALLQSGGYTATATEVLERTSSDHARDVDLLQLALHERMLQLEDTPSTSKHSAALRTRFPEYAGALEAYSIYVSFSVDGRSERVEAWLANPGDDPEGFCATIAAYIRTASGEVLPITAPNESGTNLPLQRVIGEQARLITLVRHAALSDSIEDMLIDPLNLMPGDDPVPFLVDSYVRSQLLLGLGRVSEARRTISRALSIGDLDLRFAVLYAAMLRWSAFLHHRDGRADIAGSLLSESRSYGELRGPMPGMRPEFGDALETLLTGDRQASGARFLEEARACYERSFLDSSWSTLRFAFQLDPSEAALELMDQLGTHPTYHWAAQLAEFSRAALRQDPDIILHISGLSGLPELASAADFLEDIEFYHRDKGIISSDEYARAVNEARQSFQLFREPLSRVVFRHRSPAVETLTPRELEIAPLTATLTNREIADRLTLSVRTVENHIARSMKKLGLSSRTELSTALSSVAKASSGMQSE
ncbi:LuxR family transcriptional regulator [Leucobacter komagatae]|nr:LuxR family transcriptional regulator [Leucobacter komagatae]